MTFFLTYDVHFYSILLLALVGITQWVKGDNLNNSGRIFHRLILVNICMLVLEIISWQFDGKPGKFNWYANYISNLLFSWMGPSITCIWICYIDYHMYSSYARIKRRWFYLHPMIAISFLMTINFFTPFIFSVSSDNVYSREPYIWLIIVVTSLSVIYVWVDAYRNRDRIDREIVVAMLLYILLPAVGAAIQVLVYGAFIIWPIMAITVVVTYFYLDTISTTKDYLTKLMSRQRMDSTIDYLISTKRPFILVMFDLNGFKLINDRYGHAMGDKALVLFSKVLSATFSDKATVGRFGGDEFLMTLDTTDAEEVEDLIGTLKTNLEKHVEQQQLPYPIDFSYGFKVWQPESAISYEELFNSVDMKMYQNKHLPEHDYEEQDLTLADQ